MANGVYLAYRNRMLGSGSLADTDWDGDTIDVALVDLADYTVNLTTHDAFDDVPSGAVVASGTLASVSIAAGVVDATDLTLTSVTGDQAEALVFRNNTGGGDSTDPLLLYFDTFTSGMPVTPNGGNIVLVWHSSGIFSL